MRSLNNLKKSGLLKSWKLLISVAIVLAVAVANVSSSEDLELKEDIDVPANVVHVSDLNQDGENEVLVGTVKLEDFNYVYIYRYDKDSYKKVWSFELPEDGDRGRITSITSGDSDNDGQKELVVSTGQASGTQSNNSLKIFDRDEGEKKLDFKVDYTYKLSQNTEPGSIKVGDADNDGKNEIIVGLSSSAGIVQLKYKPERNDYEVKTVQNVRSDVKTISIADVDGDKKNEIVAGTSCWKDYDLRIIEHTNANGYKNVWKNYLGYTLATTGNLDGDEREEILAYSGTHCGYVDKPKPRVWVFKCIYQYEDYSRYEEIWNKSFPSGSGFGHGGCNPVIGDLVGNESNEIAFPMNTNKTHKTVYVYGQAEGQFKQLQTIETTPSSLFIGDSDNNGVNELLICDNYDKGLNIYEKQEEKKKEKSASAKTSAPEKEKVVSSMNNTPGFELVIALLGIAITLISRKWR